MPPTAQLVGWAAIAGFAAFTLVCALHECRIRHRDLGKPRTTACGKCGYSFEGIASDLCPECGAPRGVVERLDAHQRARAALWLLPMLVVGVTGAFMNSPDGAVQLSFLAVAMLIPGAIFAVRVPVWISALVVACVLAWLMHASMNDALNDPAADPRILLGIPFGFMILSTFAILGVHQLRGGREFPDRPS